MQRTTFMILAALLVASVTEAQTSGYPSTQSTGGQPGQGQDTGQSSSAGQQPAVPLLPVRPDPTQITFGAPDQDARDAQNREQDRKQDDESRKKSARQPQTSASEPEPDIEFQEFVATALGKKFPIFGRDLFENVPSTFAPLERVQVPADYVIGPGDELVIHAWGQVNVNGTVTVDRTGAIFIPKVGNLNVAGLKYDDLHDYLESEIGRIFKNFQLSVSMGRLRSIQIFVVGQVRKPGTYTVSSLSSLVDALFASGGPSKHGSMRRIQVKRNGKTVTVFDLYDLILNGDKTKDGKLMAGDVIYVPSVGPLVALAGSVNTPAIFELKDNSTLADLLNYGGGLSTTAEGDHAVVERIDERRIRHADEFALTREGLARPLHDGDVVRILSITAKFDNAVTLRGNVARPGRYSWHPGMRVHDLIPERDFLVTEEYWKRQNQLVVDARTGEFRLNQNDLKNDVKRVSAEINWEYAAVQRFDPERLTSHLLPFNLGKAIEGDADQNLVLNPGDVVTIFSQADIQVPIAQQSKFIRLEGEVGRSGVYQIQPGETLRHLLVRLGGFTPQAYLFGSEFTRESTRVDQQKRLDEYVNELERSVQHNATANAAVTDSGDAAARKAQNDAQRALVEKMKTVKATGRIVLEIKPNAASIDAVPNLALEDGDRLLVPFRPATVNVIGAVYTSGSFMFKPGKTVSDYLRLSGGAKRDGDKGREFVIRADGSTVSKQQHNALLSRDFNTLRLMPGDTIVVPERLNQGAFMRGLKDWSQILTGFGLAAGALKSLFP